MNSSFCLLRMSTEKKKENKKRAVRERVRVSLPGSREMGKRHFDVKLTWTVSDTLRTPQNFNTAGSPLPVLLDRYGAKQRGALEGYGGLWCVVWRASR